MFSINLLLQKRIAPFDKIVNIYKTLVFTHDNYKQAYN